MPQLVPSRQLSIQGRTRLLLALGIFPMVALIGFTVLDQQVIEEAQVHADQARQVQVESQAFQITMANQKSALNLYLYTGAVTFLQSYDSGASHTAATEASLEKDAAALGLSGEAATVRATAHQWRTWAEESRAAVAVSGPPTGAGLSVEGRAVFDTFQEAADSLSERAQAGAVKALTQAQTHRRIGLALVMIGGTFAILILLGLSLLFVASVLRPIVKLARVARDLAAGRAVALPAGTRADEVGELFRALAAWQRAATEQLESEARFRAIFDRAPVGVARLDLEGRIIESNPALHEILGRSAADVQGRFLDEFVQPGDADRRFFTALFDGNGDAAQLEVRFLRKGGQIAWGHTKVVPVRRGSGTPRFVLSMVEDITERKAQQAALEHQALHDSLTGLPNRLLLHDRLEQAILSAQREGEPLAFLLMDLDRFKEVNDTFGHHYGDLLLQHVGTRLRATLRGSDTVARLGGDEFGMVLAGVPDGAEASRLAGKILQGLEQPFTIEGQTLTIAGSIGIVLFPEHGPDAATLIRRADVAMYVAKRGSGGFAVYTHEQDQHSAGQLTLVSELRHAIEGGELVLYYQPQVDCSTGRVTGVEALVRWPEARALTA